MNGLISILMGRLYNVTQTGIKIIGLTSHNLSPVLIYKAFEWIDNQ